MRDLLARFESVTKAGDGWKAKCPGHEDRVASLSIGIGDGGSALLKCHAGCTYEQIVAAARLEPDLLRGHKATSRIVATYKYCDEQKHHLYDVVRFEPKDFRQRSASGLWSIRGIRRVLYRLPDLPGATTGFIVEGEKDVDRLFALQCRATTNVGGAGKWSSDYTKQLRSCGWTQVIIIPDDDAPGHNHAQQIASSLFASGIQIKILPLPAKDVSAYLDTHDKTDLYALARSAPTWTATAAIDRAAAEPPPPKFTDLGYAEQFVMAYGLDFRWDHRRRSWLHYEKTHWEPDADSAVWRSAHDFSREQQRAALDLATTGARAEAVKHALKLENRPAMTQVLETVKTLKPVADAGANWDMNPWLLAVHNGVVNLQDHEFRAGDPADRITLQCGTAYDPAALCPRWWRFLSEIFAGDQEVIEFVWRVIGYSLTGLTTEQILVMCYGSGSNGKSVFLSALHRVFGTYGHTLPFSSLKTKSDDGIPNDIAALVGKRFVTAAEPRDGLKLDEGRIKWLTGGDPVSARFMRAEFFTFTPVAKFFCAMNHKPVIADDSFGLWRRIRLIPFTQQFRGADRDDTLTDQLTAEAPGILAWAIEGTKRWREGGLVIPGAVSAATEAYQSESDPLGEFIETCIDQSDPGAEALASDVYKRYTQWADQQGLSRFDRLSGNAFGRKFSDKFTSRHTRRGRLFMHLTVTTTSLF